MSDSLSRAIVFIARAILWGMVGISLGLMYRSFIGDLELSILHSLVGAGTVVIISLYFLWKIK